MLELNFNESFMKKQVNSKSCHDEYETYFSSSIDKHKRVKSLVLIGKLYK